MTGVEQPFLLVVEDVFVRHQGRAIAAAGAIVRGWVRPGAEVEIVGSDRNVTVQVVGIDAAGPRTARIDGAGAGMNVALLLPGTCAVERGHVLATPGSIGAHRTFGAEIAVLPENQGGSEAPAGDHLAFCIRSGAVRGVVTLPAGMDVLHPAHAAQVTVTLERSVALEVGQDFAFRRRGRAAGSGRVTRLPGTGT
ncbi:hypothetical protein ACH41H_40625 [Streptomyces sp. NPDC020800]|uniref:EF-Tu C-terminal domain-related protein n=1 Tax=Streptomyces sp. NPDC020800 TaxID=3365092 RepID=UPI00379EB5BD